MNPQGRARVENELIDLSVVIATGLQGITGVHGITERGDPTKARLVGSWTEYQKHFGGLIAASDFPLYAKRCFERGGRLRISRAVHYTDPTDASTVVGVKASLTALNNAVGVFTITGTAGTISDIGVAGPTTLFAAPVAYITNMTLTAAAVINEINTNAVGGAVAVVLTVVGNTATIQLTMNNSFDASSITVSGSGGLTGAQVTALTAPDGAEWVADNIGAWGNDLSVTVVEARNGATDEFDITIKLAGFPQLDQTIRNVAKNPTLAQMGAFNLSSNLLKFDTSVLPTLAVMAETNLTSGAENKSLIVQADFLGDSAASTGIHVLSNYNDFTRIAIPEKAIPAIDIALVAYCESHTKCKAILRTPVGISGETAIDYREGTGAYSHIPINSYYADMYFGAIEVIDPLTQNTRFISVIGDVLGCITQKDSKAGMWYAVAGSERGRIRNATAIEYNLGNPARSTEADNVDIHGINAVVDDADFGLVIWGNSSLWKGNTLLKHQNVSDLWIFLNRGLGPIVKTELFNPNDIITWKTIYRKTIPFLDLLVAKRAIHKYLYQGDQDIDKIEDAVVNDSGNIDAGQYIFNLWIAPIVGLKYIGIRTIITNSGVNFEELAEEVPVV